MTSFDTTLLNPLLRQGLALSLREVALASASDILAGDISPYVTQALMRLVPDLEFELEESVTLPQDYIDEVVERVQALWNTVKDHSDFKALVEESIADVSLGLASAVILNSANSDATSPTIAGGITAVQSWLQVSTDHDLFKPELCTPEGHFRVRAVSGSGKSFLPPDLIKSMRHE